MKSKLIVRIIASFFIIVVLLIVATSVFNNSETIAQSSITITAPSDISGWTLNPGTTNTTSSTFHVTVTAGEAATWTITASDVKPQTLGHMTKYISSYESGTQLDSAMQVQSTQTVELPAGGTILSGSGNIDFDYSVTFRQAVSWTDTPTDYRIEVTFTGTTTP